MTDDQPEHEQIGGSRPLALEPAGPPAPPGLASDVAQLNEIAREMTSILNVDELLGRVAELLNRLIDYQMFSILLVDDTGQQLTNRFSLRFQESIHLKHEIPLGRGIVGAAAESKQAIPGDPEKDSS